MIDFEQLIIRGGFMARTNLESQKTTDHEMQIKRVIQSFVGSRIELKTKSGRNKITIGGVLENACASVFIVRFTNNYGTIRTTSFRYAEVLIREVDVAIWVGEDKVPLLDTCSIFNANASFHNNSDESQNHAKLVC